ncbi:hypothetical protein SAJA_09540 [Salinisphaera japonica YTM-1]|uniref:Uncharacterized protein n=1 Tax=Salinisphaera japonica YTM-1 TaxID=1209778 RepID=A0A423PPB1_9GAMM|nr:hypothetical protein SAJA_09540 [Salinisphaera japonica YTM-1]
MRPSITTVLSGRPARYRTERVFYLIVFLYGLLVRIVQGSIMRKARSSPAVSRHATRNGPAHGRG